MEGYVIINQTLKRVTFVFVVICFFMISSSRLLSFPIDKAIMFFISGCLLFYYFLQGKSISKGSILMLLLIMGLIVASFSLNLPESSPIIFFPFMGLLFAYLVSEEQRFLNIIYLAIFFHLMLGILFFVLSYTGRINSYVHPMYDKGLPFIHAVKGFTSTVQTFGTLAITWLLIYYWKAERLLITKIDRIAYIFVVIALVLTFNRNSFIIFYLMLFFRQKGVFLIISIFLLTFYLVFFDTVNSLLFNLTTITSRSDLLQGFKIAFLDLANWKEYLVGHGNNMIPEAIARRTVYRTGYIENGTSVLLYTYGFLGYSLYILAVGTLCLLFIFRKSLFYAVLGGYILLIAQQFTHEFFSTTFYLLIAVLLLIMKSNIVSNKSISANA